MEDEKGRDESVQQALENRWRRVKDHYNSYPYVWASYAFVFGGLGLYTAYRWRALRKAEDELLRFQEKLKMRMTAEEIAEAMKETQSGRV